MKTMAITQFKTYALRVIDQVSRSQEHIVITKRGRPLAELIPFKKTVKKSIPGKLAGTLVFEKEIVAPLGKEVWKA